jgi:hypothetical protein
MFDMDILGYPPATGLGHTAALHSNRTIYDLLCMLVESADGQQQDIPQPQC